MFFMVIETVSSHLGPLLTKIPGVTPVNWRLLGSPGKGEIRSHQRPCLEFLNDECC